MFVISDFDRISDTSNITLDAGVGNLIQSIGASASSLIIITPGRSVTIQLVDIIGSYKWMVI